MKRHALLALTLALTGCLASSGETPQNTNNNNTNQNNNNNNQNNNNNNNTPGCISTAPQCEGSGPNSGCDDGYFCNTTCTCQEEVTCLVDAPQCEGNGPNSGCQVDFFCNTACECEAEPPPPVTDLLTRPSRSTAVDITRDDQVVAMVNTDDGSVSFFNAAEGQESRIAKVASSQQANAEPVAVVFHPDQTQAFVANRAAGSVARIVDANTAQARLSGELTLGGEVMGLALSPTGKTAWATNWIDGTLTAIDTETMQVRRTIELGATPFAVAVTNDGDDDDDDEKILVTRFYGRGTGAEAEDLGREGVVRVIDASGGPAREIVLAPLANCFDAPVNGNPLVSGCFPNQLNSITIHTAFGKTYAYVTSVAASPAGPVVFNHNVQALVSVIDVDAEAEVGCAHPEPQRPHQGPAARRRR
ncbi:MAG: hypothetical protein H6730_32675 [Deltaproteobacteria bacterium]|nr:hypothetical protein [Deltaproteobacteria bacterium]